MKAEFIKSAAIIQQAPDTDLPEIAFAGRSNVGKSSLINTVLKRKNLVKTGKTPGKTRLLNFFNIDDKFVLTDLPGYGYAQVSKNEKMRWHKTLNDYFFVRKNLVLCFLLVDIRRGLQEEEYQMIDMLQHYNIACEIILTKADKLSNNGVINSKFKISKDTGIPLNSLIHFSIVTGDGKVAIQDIISKKVNIIWKD